MKVLHVNGKLIGVKFFKQPGGVRIREFYHANIVTAEEVMQLNNKLDSMRIPKKRKNVA